VPCRTHHRTQHHRMFASQAVGPVRTCKEVKGAPHTRTHTHTHTHTRDNTCTHIVIARYGLKETCDQHAHARSQHVHWYHGPCTPKDPKGLPLSCSIHESTYLTVRISQRRVFAGGMRLTGGPSAHMLIAGEVGPGAGWMQPPGTFVV
jgi:hypothetical protein